MGERWDGKTYWLRARVAANPDDVVKSLDSLRKDREKAKELEEVKKRADALLAENKRLKDELKTAEGLKEKKQEEYTQGIRRLDAIEWFRRGVSLYQSGNYNGSIEAFTRAIELDPKDAAAYTFRGIAYYKLGNFEQAVRDLKIAARLGNEVAQNFLRKQGIDW